MDVYKAAEVRPGVWAIDERTGRMYLVTGAERAVLIDSGYGGGDIRAFIKSLYDGPVTLMHTHAHSDHTGCDGLFEEVWATRAEWPALLQAGVPQERLQELREGDVIDLGDRKLCVMETPGHTAGSASFFDAENRLLFSGDNVSDKTVYLSMPGADMQAYRQTLARFWTMYPAWETLLGHHGRPEQPVEQLRRMMAITDAVLADQLKPVRVNAWGDVWFGKVELDGASLFLPE